MRTLLLLIALLLTPPVLAQNFPPLQGKPVLDAANIIPDKDEAALNEKLFNVIKKSKHQVMVLTVPSLEGVSIEDYGYKAGRFYGVGDKDADDGVLLTVAYGDKKMRVDVGRGLEPLLTDAKSSEVISAIKPFMKNRDPVNGINAGVDAIAEIITPLSPEQIKIQQRADAQRKARNQAFWNSFLNFLGGFILFIVSLLGAFTAYWKLTAKKRQLKREEEEQKRLAKLRAAEELRQRQANARRNAYQIQAQQEAARLEKLRREREEMLNNMTPAVRAAFLEREQQQKQQLENERLLRERRRRDEEREREEARKRSASATSYGGYTSSSSDYGSSSYSSSSSSSSDSSSSFSGGGGDFGGGGSSGSWD